MVYDADTYEIYHPLTKQGRLDYQKILEQKADEILFKHHHPIKYCTSKLLEFLKIQ